MAEPEVVDAAMTQIVVRTPGVPTNWVAKRKRRDDGTLWSVVCPDCDVRWRTFVYDEEIALADNPIRVEVEHVEQAAFKLLARKEHQAVHPGLSSAHAYETLRRAAVGAKLDATDG